LPQMKRSQDLAFWRAEIGEFVVKVEELTGARI